jgi:hypothetical protein
MVRILAALFALAMLAVPAGVAIAAQPAPEAPVEYRDTPAAQSGEGRKVAGMWNGTRPARGGAYRWPYLAIGSVVAVFATVGLIKYVRYVERMRRRTVADQ